MREGNVAPVARRRRALHIGPGLRPLTAERRPPGRAAQVNRSAEAAACLLCIDWALLRGCLGRRASRVEAVTLPRTLWGSRRWPAGSGSGPSPTRAARVAAMMHWGLVFILLLRGRRIPAACCNTL